MMIKETQRLANIVVQNIPRMNNVDVDINGYHIPARTIIIPQISTVMYDEKVGDMMHINLNSERFQIFPEPYKF